jgi:hypothetical protein
MGGGYNDAITILFILFLVPIVVMLMMSVEIKPGCTLLGQSCRGRRRRCCFRNKRSTTIPTSFANTTVAATVKAMPSG